MLGQVHHIDTRAKVMTVFEVGPSLWLLGSLTWKHLS